MLQLIDAESTSSKKSLAKEYDISFYAFVMYLRIYGKYSNSSFDLM